MSEIQNSGTTPVRPAHRFNEPSLATYMEVFVPDYEGPLKVEQFRGGQSNPTYKLTTPKRTYVLRKRPPGKLLAGAHDVGREAKVMKALGKAGFPVPQVVNFCMDDAVIGTWFYIMEMVEGRVIWDATVPDVSPKMRPLYFDAMNATLAQLHKVDYAAIGLADFGKPGNYFERQIGRWSKQYLADTAAGRDPHLDKLIDWLPARIPKDDETVLVHGDFRIDNMIFHPAKPQVLAVLDWELSTLGHPLADLSYHLMMYHLQPKVIAGLVGADLQALNIPSEEDYIAAYCKRTGREGIPDLGFYLAYNLFRLAAIFHGIKGRAARGTAASPHATKMIEELPVIAELAWKQAQRVG